MLDGPRIPIASCGTASTCFLINIGFGGGGGRVFLHPPRCKLSAPAEQMRRNKLSMVSASLPMTCWGVFCLCLPRLSTEVYGNGNVKGIMTTRPLLHKFDRGQDRGRHKMISIKVKLDQARSRSKRTLIQLYFHWIYFKHTRPRFRLNSKSTTTRTGSNLF